ncbi:MAG: 50S ribosomal protein L25/general stress protein Ctc [Pseudomonadota bacterium]
MSTTVALKAAARPRVGKGAARAVRREGRVPAVIYGGKKPPEAISIAYNETLKLLHSGHFMTTVFEIDVGGKKTRALPRDFQLDPVKDLPVHVDFLRVSADSRITVAIPVVFLNQETCPGVRRGGVLNIVRHEVEVEAPADAIPDTIEVDLASADLGDTIHISAVTLPDGVVPTITDRDFTIATIAAPAGLKEDTGDEEVEGDEDTGSEEE